MLNSRERSITFYLMCAAVVAVFAVQLVLVYVVLFTEFTNVKLALSAIESGALGAVGWQFVRIVRENFTGRATMPFEKLHGLMSRRCEIAENSILSSTDPYTHRKNLVTNTLEFAEGLLRERLPGAHFELCVFVDDKQPLLFAYYDSNRATAARSMSRRRREPNYYVDAGYEVVKLLRQPTSRPRIIEDTTAPASKYEFTSPEQKKQIRSTLLLCIDVSKPCALVVSCDRVNAFTEKDAELHAEVKFLSSLIRYDLVEGGFFGKIRHYMSEFFNW